MKHFRLALFAASLALAAASVTPNSVPAAHYGDPIACWPYTCDDPPPQQGGGGN